MNPQALFRGDGSETGVNLRFPVPPASPRGCRQFTLASFCPMHEDEEDDLEREEVTVNRPCLFMRTLLTLLISARCRFAATGFSVSGDTSQIAFFTGEAAFELDFLGETFSTQKVLADEIHFSRFWATRSASKLQNGR